MKRRLLIVSPHFPPTNAPDHQRARQCLRYLGHHGWEAEVLAVEPAGVAAPMDPLLMEALPGDTIIHRVPAIPLRLARILGCGSLGLRSLLPLRRAGHRLLRDRSFDLVFFTTTQFLALTLGPRWKRQTGIPYVIDWQDPWLTDFYSRPGAPQPPGGWKYRFAQWQAKRYEGICVRDAAGFVATSPDYLTQLSVRYGDGAAKPAAVVPFGADPADFAVARREEIAPAFRRRAGVRHLVFIGAVGPIMEDALRLLFAGLAQLTRAETSPSWRLHFIGTSYAPAAQAKPSVLPLAEAAGVAHLVEEHPGRVGHFVALRTMLEADALLLLGSADRSYAPSKLAWLALAAKPVLALIPGGGQLETTLRDLSFVHVARFAPGPDVARVIEFLRKPPAVTDEPSIGGGTAEDRTADLCRVFDRALAPQPTTGTRPAAH